VIIPFDKAEPTGNTVIDRIFQRIITTLQSLRLAVTNDILKVVTFPLAATDLQVRHGLNGPVRTFEVVRRADDVNVWESMTVNPNPREFIILQVSGAPCTLTIRFM